jgi:maltose/moltooligosaccharide transporter
MPNQSFPWRRTFIIGLGFLGISIIWPIFNQYIPLFLQAGNPEFNAQLLREGREIPNIVGFALPPYIALFIMTWDNIINVFMQPWVGERSDRTWNRFGRRKGWILLGMPIAAIAFVFIPLAQSLLAIAVFILITNFGMALFRSPTVAWLGDLFDVENRSKANGVINLMGGLGGLLAYFGGGILFNQVGRAAPFIAGSIFLAIVSLAAVVLVKEPREIARDPSATTGVRANLRVVLNSQDRSILFVLLGILLWFMAFNALETGLSSFAVFSLGMKAGDASIYAGGVNISFILFAIPAGLLGTKIGRRRAIRIGLAGLTLTLLIGYFVVQNGLTFVLFLIPAGAFWASVNVNSLPLVYDYGDEHKIGAYTGLYYFSSQLAAVLGPTLGGVLVTALGSQYRWLFMFSTVFMALAFVAITGVRAKQPQPQLALTAE